MNTFDVVDEFARYLRAVRWPFSASATPTHEKMYGVASTVAWFPPAHVIKRVIQLYRDELVEDDPGRRTHEDWHIRFEDVMGVSLPRA